MFQSLSCGGCGVKALIQVRSRIRRLIQAAFEIAEQYVGCMQRIADARKGERRIGDVHQIDVAGEHHQGAAHVQVLSRERHGRQGYVGQARLSPNSACHARRIYRIPGSGTKRDRCHIRVRFSSLLGYKIYIARQQKYLTRALKMAEWEPCWVPSTDTGTCPPKPPPLVELQRNPPGLRFFCLVDVAKQHYCGLVIPT